MVKHTLQSIRKPGRMMVILAGLLVLTTSLVYLLISPGTGSVSIGLVELPDATEDKPLVALSVLPFRVIGASSGLFDQGLRQQVETALTRLVGVRVISNRMHRDEVGEDLQALGKTLGADYLLDTSIRRVGEELRLHASLVDVNKGSIAFSESFDGKLEDVFETQTALSAEVAAALGVKLSKDSYEYGLYPVAEFGHAGVAKLLELRHQTMIGQRDQYVSHARQTLEVMNRTFPDNPHILGVLALAQRSENIVKGPQTPVQDTLALAKYALALDPVNLDALTVLVLIYDDMPHKFHEADAIHDRIVALYPGYSWVQRKRLMFKTATLKLPCDDPELMLAVDKNGHLGPVDREVFELGFLFCTDRPAYHRALESAHVGAHHYFRQRVDPDYGLLFARQNPKALQDSFMRVYHFEKLLWLEQKEAATRLIAGMDLSANSLVTSFLASSAMMMDLRYPKRPSDLVDFRIDYLGSISDLQFSTALAKEVRVTGDLTPLERYLAAVPPFPLDVSTIDFGAGLLILQYQAGQVERASETADRLHRALHDYSERTPLSERAYGLLRFHFMLAYYSGHEHEAPDLLEAMIDNDEALWSVGLMLQTLLDPWQEHPTVQRFHQLVEADKARISALAGFR